MVNTNCRKISVVVPVYKVEAYLPQCIESIIHQTYSNIDIILVDDGSPDHCGVICDYYAENDSRIRVFHTENKGLSSARNYGLQKAMDIDSQYIVFIDSDDWIEKNMFEVLLTAVETNNADISICGYYEDYSHERKMIPMADMIYNNNELVINLLKRNINENVWNKLWKKELFTDIQFPEGHVFEDVATVYKVFLKAACAISKAQALYHYRKTRAGNIIQTHTMNNLVDYWLAHKSRFDSVKHNKAFNTDPELMEKMIYGCTLAIVILWKWCYAAKERDAFSQQMEDMVLFSKQYIPLFGKPGWSFKFRFCAFWTKFQNKGVFFMLYYLTYLHQWIGNLLLADCNKNSI